MNFSEKQERAKGKHYLYKGYTVKGEVPVKQHEKCDHIVIKSFKDIDNSLYHHQELLTFIVDFFSFNIQVFIYFSICFDYFSS